MADYNPAMPSEDEDFDAVTAPPARRKPRTPRVNPVVTDSNIDTVSPEPKVISTTPFETVQESEAVTVPITEAQSKPEVEEPAYEAPQQPEIPKAVASKMPTRRVFVAEVADESDEPSQSAAVPSSPEVVTAPPEPTPSSEYPEFVEPLNQPSQLDITEVAPQLKEKPAKPPKPAKSPRSANSGKLFGLAFVTILLALVVIGLSFWAWKLHASRNDLQADVTSLNAKVSTIEANPQVLVQQQTDALLKRVGALMTLPASEVPTIADVSDVSQARQQSTFFSTAANGDKVLMYAKAGEAILYRPSTNKIILVAPLTFSSAASSTATTTKQP
jgi:hypothetical protein